MTEHERVSGDFALEPLGEKALVLRFGDRIDEVVNARVHAAAAALIAAAMPGVTDVVPAYATIAVHFQPSTWIARGNDSPWRQFAHAVRSVVASASIASATPQSTVEIAVCYGGEYGPDLEGVARHCGLNEDEVIARHTATDYRVAMIGFAPGFPYLFGLDPSLHMPRRDSPRVRVPTGSVAIGGAQTGVYPSELPGGWQLIGRTPMILFDPTRTAPSLLAAGTRVRFRAIAASEFEA